MIVDAERLCDALMGTYLENNQRKRELIEADLAEMAESEGYVEALVNIVCDEDIEYHVRQSALVNLKNLVVYEWDANRGPTRKEKQEGATNWGVLRDEDKELLRDNIMEMINNTSYQSLRKLWGDIVINMLRTDYNDNNWPYLIEDIIKGVESGDFENMYGPLLCFRKLATHREYKDEREDMVELEDRLFPTMYEHIKVLREDDSTESVLLQKLILKIYFSSCRVGLNSFQRDSAAFMEWMHLFADMLEAPIPAEQDEWSNKKKLKSAHWKLKKWVLHIWFRLFNKFGFPSHFTPDENMDAILEDVEEDEELTDEEKEAKKEAILEEAEERKEMHTFSVQLIEDYADTMISLTVEVMRTPLGEDRWIHPRLLQIGLNIMTIVIFQADTYSFLKPHIDAILFDVVFPNLMMTEQDLHEFENDPEEYIRRLYDVDEEVVMPKPAAADLLANMVRFRKKNMLTKWMNHVYTVLEDYRAAVDNGDEPDYLMKEAALTGIGVLENSLKHNEDYRGRIVDWINDYVLPDCTCEQPFMRARAIWTISQYVTMEFDDPEVYKQCLDTTLELLQDESLPVRINAAISLRSFLQDDDIKEALEEHMEDIMYVLMGMVGSSSSDDVISTITSFVYMFQEEIRPYAQDMVETMVEELHQYMEDGKDDDITSGLATETLHLLSVLLGVCQEDSEMMTEMGHIIHPVIVDTLGEEGAEFLDEGMELLSYITFAASEVTDEYWDLLPMMFAAFHGWAFDYLAEMMRPLINFMERDAKHFATLNGGENVNDCVGVCEKMLCNPDKVDAYQSATAIQLLINVVQYCEGMLNEEQYSALWNHVVFRVEHKDHGSMGILVADAISALWYYDAEESMAILSENDAVDLVMDFWATTAPNMQRAYDLKITCLGALSLLRVPVDKLPAQVGDNYGELLEQTLSLYVQLSTIAEFTQHEVAAIEAKRQQEEEDDLKALTYDVDLEDDEDAAVFAGSQLQQMREEVIRARMGDFELVDDDDMDTPLEDVDEWQALEEFLEHMRTNEPDMYKELIEECNEDMAQDLDVIMRMIEGANKSRDAKGRRSDKGFRFSSH